MDPLSERLASAQIVGMDTSLFIYHLEANPRYVPLTKTIFKGIENGKWRGIASTITLMEITVRPWQLGREMVAREYETVLLHFPNLALVDVDRNVARTAAMLRAKFNIATPDALLVATSLTTGAKSFLTNDKRLSKLQALIDVIVLDDFLI